jgi:hypothetical protein
MVHLKALALVASASALITPSYAAYVLKKNYSGNTFTSGFNFRTVWLILRVPETMQETVS